MGATTSQAALNECLNADTPSQECLTQDPTMLKLENIGMGLVMGVGAAVGATWKMGQGEK